ncbi:MAG: hypothetical protein PPP58_08540 [Natronomonas sp.]
MYRAIIPNGRLECADYDEAEHGLRLYDDDGELLAFVPYENLEALLTDAAYESTERSAL